MYKKYNYYKSVKKKTDMMFDELNFREHMESQDSLFIETNKQKFYNLMLNICNQVIYDDFYYLLSADDVLFIENFQIDKNFELIIDRLKDDIFKRIEIEMRDCDD